MARLNVEATGYAPQETVAGTSSLVQAAVSVSDANGSPVKGLTQNNFTIAISPLGPPPNMVVIGTIEEVQQPAFAVDGFYVIYLYPEVAWEQSDYVFEVVVSRSTIAKATGGVPLPWISWDRGQTLFGITIQA